MSSQALLPIYPPHPTIFLKSILTLGLYNSAGNKDKSNNVLHRNGEAAELNTFYLHPSSSEKSSYGPYMPRVL